MATKSDLQDWVEDALRSNRGSATLVEVARHIWKKHETDLKLSGDLFFTWQYDMRWAANVLRRRGVNEGGWTLAERSLATQERLVA